MKKEYHRFSVMKKDILKERDNITDSQLKIYYASVINRIKNRLRLKILIVKY